MAERGVPEPEEVSDAQSLSQRAGDECMVRIILGQESSQSMARALASTFPGKSSRGHGFQKTKVVYGILQKSQRYAIGSIHCCARKPTDRIRSRA